MRNFHPLTVLVFFAAMITELMAASSPILSFILLAGAYLIFLRINGIRGAVKTAFGIGIIIFILSVMNLLFVHRGATPLFFINGKAVTLESAAYGVFSSVRLAAGILWCRNFSIIMTNDRIYCLTGKLSPKLTAMLTTAVRFIPDMISQAGKINAYTKISGKFNSELKRLMAVFSALVTWSIESGVHTADSMKCRGFELGGRTSYSNYTIKSEDLTLMILSIVSAILIFILSDRISLDFYPKIKNNTQIIPIAVSVISSASAFLFPIFFSIITERKRGKRI